MPAVMPGPGQVPGTAAQSSCEGTVHRLSCPVILHNRGERERRYVCILVYGHTLKTDFLRARPHDTRRREIQT